MCRIVGRLVRLPLLFPSPSPSPFSFPHLIQSLYSLTPSPPDFRRVLKKSNVRTLHVLPDHNKLLIHSDEGLESYALGLVAGVAQLSTRPQELDASREQISAADAAVLFVRVGKIGGRTMGE